MPLLVIKNKRLSKTKYWACVKKAQIPNYMFKFGITNQTSVWNLIILDSGSNLGPFDQELSAQTREDMLRLFCFALILF